MTCVLIDGSNICRDSTLAPGNTSASWKRLEQLIAAATNQISGISSFFVVVDRSLYPRLASTGKEKLRDLRRNGQLEESKFADERLLDLAFSETSPIASGVIATLDRFDDFRRRYPELETADAIAWKPDHSGNPNPYLRPFGPRHHQKMSRKEEDGELLDRNLRRYEVQDRAAAHYYRCITDLCITAQLWPDFLKELPLYDENIDFFICPTCKKPLEKGKRRPATTAVVVFVEDREVGRILVEDGPGISIGRVASARCIGLDRLISSGAFNQISRHHIHLRFHSQNLIVQDLGSTNGTNMADLASAATDINILSPGQDYNWTLNKKLCLPNGISLERSGRRLPISGEKASETTSTSFAPPTVRRMPN
jgi:hypothetical protein